MNDINPMVSVYCLAYNHEKYIRSALEGFVSQKTTFSFEVFVHDDASTDNTATIIQEYANKFPDIIKPVYEEVNVYSQGIDAPKDILFPKFRGKYVAVCEGDDFWCDEYKLQKQVDFLENHLEYVACAHNTLRYNVQTQKKEIMYDNSFEHDICIEEALRGGASCYHTSSIVYRVEYMQNRPEFFNHTDVGDYPLAIYLTLSGKVRFLNQIMSVYRIFTESSWTVNSYSKPKYIQNVMLKNNEMLLSVNDFSKDAYKEMIDTLILQNEYLGYEITGNYKKLFDHKYRNIWREKPLDFKIKRIIKKYAGRFLIAVINKQVESNTDEY